MKYKTTILFIVIFLITSSLHAQTYIHASGGFMSNNGYSVSSSFNNFSVFGEAIVNPAVQSNSFSSSMGWIYSADQKEPEYVISGKIQYEGPQTGTLFVIAYDSENSDKIVKVNSQTWNTNTSSSYFTIQVPNGSYYLRAYIGDSLANDQQEDWEACGVYQTNIIVITDDNDAMLRNFNLTDPDINENSLPDWWEHLYAITDGPNGDNDEDGYSNMHEFTNETDPISEDAPFGDGYNVDSDYRDYQMVSSIPAQPRAQAGGNFRLDIQYTTSDNNPELSGLGLEIHYNSKKLRIVETSNIISGAIGMPFTKNEDGENDTDTVLIIAWSDINNGLWPACDLPATLLSVSFVINESLQDGEQSTIYYRTTSLANDYQFFAESTLIEVQSFNLDIDGNNQCDALTDGLLVIRYLFGLTGQSLVKNSFDPDGSRNSDEEISAYIEGGMNALDIDGNNRSDALTDGLLVIRHLFGLEGQSLIKNAVDPLGTRTEINEIESYLQNLYLKQ